MSLVNIYLEASPLTSSGNKFIQDSVFINSFERLSCSIRNKGLEIPPNCVTENKILLESKYDVDRDYIIAKKKKKKKTKRQLRTAISPLCDSVYRSQSRSRSLSRSRSPGEKRHFGDYKKKMFRSRYMKRSAPMAQFEACTAESEIMVDCADSYILSASPVAFGTSTPASSAAFCPSVPAPSAAFGVSVPAQTSAFGANVRGQCLFGSSPGQGFSFGNISAEALSLQPNVLFRGFQQDNVNIPETFISKMPTYELKTLKLSMEVQREIFSLDMTTSCQSENSISSLKEKKMHLLSVVSMALMYSSNLKNENDTYRQTLDKSANDVRLFDPEFVLKVALYARQELHIRTVTNFLLSYAAIHENTRLYLEKYFEACIVIPSDWIQVAEYYQVLNSKSKLYLPAALRRAMKKTFSKFDQYQLAKYNKSKSKNSKKEDEEKKEDEDMTENVMKHSSIFTFKKLIRVLHIDSPTEHVMCLLGKKYPSSSEEFKKSGLPGVWDSRRAGTRMKLPVPETWETQLPLHGNKASTWETLIDNNKLPYMATLRNIRNLVLSGISPMHHEKVIKHLENKKAVINSRQLPMQYFEAYKVLSDLADMYTSPDTKVVDSKDLPFWVRRQQRKMKNRLEEGSKSIVEQYKTAVRNALEISSLNNVHPVPGKTLVICIIGSADSTSTLKMQSFETCIMMGLMCLKACENCKMNILCYSSPPDVISLNESDNFLDILMETCSKYKKLLADLGYSSAKNQSHSIVKVLDYYLRPQTILSLKLDHIILLQNFIVPIQDIMSSFLNKYRQIVNPNLLYTDVNYSITGQRFSESHLSEKDVYLCGSSSSLIKFIAERSRGGQLEYIDNIDENYNLPKIDEFKKHADSNLLSTMPDETSVVPIKCRMPKWHTVRIFISSTFKDMMSERDLLIRYVFPELNRRAASVFIRIVEIDLRWGITETDSSTKRAAELCLLEAQKADFFVGLIGDRYGTIYDFDPPDSAELQWINGYEGLSITELEMHAAALRNPESKRSKAFFYIRDNSFLRNVPQKWKSHFDSEDFNSKAKVEQLKNKIKSNSFKVLDGYTCHWAGIYENKPVLAGLDILGNKVLEDLWEAVQSIHKNDPYFDNVEEEEIYQQNLIDSQHFYVGEKNAPVESTVNNLKLKHGVFVICGCCGSGKTAFSIKLLQHLKGFVLVKFFIGSSPRSRDLTYMLQFIVNSICQQLSISIALPNSPIDIVNQFPDILMEAAKYRRGKEIILLIDGLDHLEEEDQKLDWLPLSLPDGVQMICTVSESSDAFKVLNSRQFSGNDVFIEELPLLQQTDRQKFIKDYLSYYSKTVDENVFNNHMLKFVTKKDSSNPSYLRLVSDFLRIYATFDNLELMIQRMPSSLASLFQEIILQMEKEFGSTLVQTVLILLCSTKEGLEDNDLHFILSFVMHMNEFNKTLSFGELKEKIKCLEPEQLICQVKYCSLMYVISTFAYGTIMWKQSFSLVSSEFENAVKKFYLNKNNASQSNFLHSVLAGYYYNICDPNNDGQYSQKSGVAIRSYLYHMFHANLYKELSDLLCNYKFLEAAFMTSTGAQLMEYFSSLLYDILPTNHKVSREINSNLLLTFNNFVTRNFHIFQQYPQLIMQQALNEPLDSSICLQSEDCSYDFLENLSRSHIVDYRLASFCGFVKNITASASEKGQEFVVLGSQDGYLKVLDLSTFKVVRTIKGHVSTITCICFVGKNKMCASSIDGTLSLWDSVHFKRIAVLQGHRHIVTSCCGDPSGSILYSSGWDNSVRLWSLVDGRAISVIDEFRSPVNCIDHHPLKQQIACGLWNGNIEIWDTVSLKKSLAIPCFSGSVKSLAYTPDGINIISSFIESEISIWSSEEGIKISSLKGHILPVKALSFSPDNSIFITGSDDCTLKVWSSTHGPYFSTISDCKFCPISLMNFMSENLLAVAYQNSDIWIIDINSGRVIYKISLVEDIVSAFSKYSHVALDAIDSENNFTEKSVVFGTQAGKLMIGDFLTSSVSVRAEMNSKITVAIHNCDTIICGTAEGDIGVFSFHDDFDATDQMFRIISAAHRGFISSFSLAVKDEKLFVLSTANDNVFKIWHIDKDICDVILIQELLSKHKDGVTCSLFYPYCSDSSLLDNLFTGSHDNNIISWKNDSVKIFQGLHSSIVNITCFGDFILGCGNDGAIVIWSQNQKVVSSIPGLELSSTILTFFVAEDDLNKFAVTLAYVDQDGSIKVKKPLQQTSSCSFEGHSKPITSCCTSNNGNVISCSLDGSVNVWKIPDNDTDIQLMHSAFVTGVIISPSLEFAASSDAHGNIIFWKIDITSSTTPLSYAGKKSYVGGFIRALSWMKDNKVVYAVTKHVEDSDKSYFVHVTSFEYISSNDVATLSFELENSYFFESEVLSLHSSPNADIIIVGLRCGNVSIINPETQYIVKISDDWLVGVQLFSGKEKTDLCSIAFVDGSIKLYKVNDFITKKSVTPIQIYEPQPLSNDSKFVTSFCCGEGTLMCVGDSGGVLRIYDEDNLKFIEKVHSDAISGICIAGSCIFTSSPDKTVKGWSLKSFKQICQFHSNVPISCLASADVCADICDSSSCYLLIGTTSGSINLLKFHSK